MKRWLRLMLIAACLPFPALSQTTNGHQDPELSEAYTRFFYRVWGLMELDIQQMRLRDRMLLNSCPNPNCPNDPANSPKVRRYVLHSGRKNADGWLAERLFSPDDIARIENAVSQWYIDRQLVGVTLQKAPGDVPDFSNRFDQRYAGIALDTGTKLESQLEERQHFHNMIRDCAHRLRFAPEYDESRCFAPPKPRFT